MQMAVSQAGSCDAGCAMRPRHGEEVGGDLALVLPRGDQLLLVIVDVLGHGPLAYPLTQQIAAELSTGTSAEVRSLMQDLHQRFQGSRGAAIGLCAIDTASGRLDYVGVGNTTLRRFGKGESRLVSQDGVLGQNMRSLKLQTMQLEAGEVLLMHTDGISARFGDTEYPGLRLHPAQQVADNIVQRFAKDHDDAACVVLRYQP